LANIASWVALIEPWLDSFSARTRNLNLLIITAMMYPNTPYAVTFPAFNHNHCVGSIFRWITFSRLIIRLKRVPILIAFVFFAVPQITHAQNALSEEKLGALLTVINMLLLSEDAQVDLAFNEVDDGVFSVSNEFEVSFEQQTGDIELCFVVDSTSGLSNQNVSLILNGNITLDPIELGENCYLIPVAQQQSLNSLVFVVNGSGSVRLSSVGVGNAVENQANLNTLTRSGWDERAVRKVLKIFAFGGHATDQQILTWSYMQPSEAIKEMLNFDQHNLKLSPLAPGEKYSRSAGSKASSAFADIGTLTAWQNFISNDDPGSENYSPIPRVVPDDNGGEPNYPRRQYGLDGYNFDDAYNRMITVRGMNPFRQRIGFWETNYHLATNLEASVTRAQMALYYDEIMNAHEAGLAYKDVMGVAAKSAAVAMQYGHRNNRWNRDEGENGQCECNEDFAREIHQLYYGIFGVHDPLPSDGISGPDYHENVTIPETAKMLTGMHVPYIRDFGFALTVGFIDAVADDVQIQSPYLPHHPGAVTILGQSVAGLNASQKIDALMPISMQHPESLENLPVMIVSVLANDNLSEANKNELRSAWSSLGVNRNFLEFIRAYAISEQFHSPTQFKYLTSHERALYMANKQNLHNIEAYFGGSYYNGGRAGRSVGGIITDDFAGDFFEPLHNVFGGQTSLEASDSALVFEQNYNRQTDDEDDTRRIVACDECDLGQPWEKQWSTVLPRRADGNYYVEDIAPWLWRHAVGHLDNFTQLERAHLYSLLGATRRVVDQGRGDVNQDGEHPFDLNLVMCVIADYQVEEGASDAPILSILTNGTWDNYCRENDNGGSFEQHELTALNAQLSGTGIANNAEIQAVLTQLGQVTLRFNATQGFDYFEVRPDDYELLPDGGASIRKHANEAVNNALGFIFATPFIFAEGQ